MLIEIRINTQFILYTLKNELLYSWVFIFELTVLLSVTLNLTLLSSLKENSTIYMSNSLFNMPFLHRKIAENVFSLPSTHGFSLSFISYKTWEKFSNYYSYIDVPYEERHHSGRYENYSTAQGFLEKEAQFASLLRRLVQLIMQLL